MPSSEKSLSKTEMFVLTTAFGFLALSIIIGNSLTIGAFTKTRLFRRPTHYFLISLAVADLMVGSFAMPLYISHFIDLDFWRASQVLQAFYYTLDILSGVASVLTLAVVSVERLYAVGWPWKYRHSSSLTAYAISVAVTWLLAVTVSCLYLAFRFKIISDAVHFVSVLLLSISVVVICTSYAGLWHRVKQRRKRCKRHEKDRKLATTLCVITGVFVVTWTPFEIMIILVHFCKTCGYPPLRLVYTIKLLQYSNSLLNTLVYSLRMPEFRKAIVSFLKSGSLTSKTNPLDKRTAEIPLTSGSYSDDSCSTFNERFKGLGSQLERKKNPKVERKLAKIRTDLFSIR